MHETTIAQSILESVLSKLNYSNQKIEADRVDLLVGEFRNVDPDSLTFAYNALKVDYPSLQHSQLNITIVPLTAVCNLYSHTYSPRAVDAFCCPQCKGGIDHIVSGKELDIVGIAARTT